MRRKSLGKGIHALIRTPKKEPEEDESKPMEAEEYEEPVSEEAPEQTSEQPYEQSTEQPAITPPEPETGKEDPVIPDEIIQQLKEIKEVDFDEKRVITYQKALERAWFDEKITADEQFILDGLREVLEITEEEHKSIETFILHELEKRYSEGIDKRIPLGKIEDEHDRRKREIYDYFQRGSEYYESDKFFEAIMEWEKILELDPVNPIIMKAINNARRNLESPEIESLGQKPVYTYTNPAKESTKAKKSEKRKPTKKPDQQMQASTDTWLSQQQDIQAQLKALKEEEDELTHRTNKLFKQGYKNYKIGKYLRAIKIFKKVLTMDPDHEKSKKGLRFARKRYKAKKKELEKKKSKAKLLRAKKTQAELEMEIPETAEDAAESARKAEIKVEEMEIPEIELQSDLSIDDGGIPIITAEVIDEPLVDETAPESDPETAHIPEPEPLPEPEPVPAPEPEAAPEPEPEPDLSMDLPPVDEIPAFPEPEHETVPEIYKRLPEIDEPISVPEIADAEIVDAEIVDAEIIDAAVDDVRVVEAEVAPEEVHDEFTFAPPRVVSSEPPAPKLEIKVEEKEPMQPGKSPEELSKDLYDRALNLVKVGRFKDAMDVLDDVLALNPNNSDAWNDKGILYWTLGQFENALESYERAVEMNPSYADAWINKGVVLNNLERREDALRAYDRALDLNSNLEEAWTNKGVALFKLKRLPEAAESFNKGLQINPKSEEAWLNLGYTYEKMERFSDAVKSFEKVLEINADNQDAHTGLVECQKNMKYELLRVWNI